MTTLILAEKSSQLEQISAGLGLNGGRGRYQGAYYQIMAASGHVLEFESPEEAKPNISWRDPGTLLPLPRNPKLIPTKKHADKVSRFRKALADVDDVILATDPDREGEAIGRNLLAYCGYNGKLRRLMLGKGLGPKAIQQQFGRLLDESEVRGLYYAQQARATADYLYMYVTMAYTALGRAGGMGQSLGQGKGRASVVSVGRVQSAVVRMIVVREQQILNFKSVDHFVVKLRISQNGNSCDLTYYPTIAEDTHGEKRSDIEWRYSTNPQPDEKPKPLFVDRNRVQAFSTRLKEAGEIGLACQTRPKKKAPPQCFSQGDLQQEAAKRFKMTAKKTLEATDALYKKEHVSYPRTSERKLSVGVFDDAPETLEKLVAYGFGPAAEAHRHIQDAETERPNVYSTKDMTHDGLFPTSLVPESALSGDEAKIYDLIVKRYIQAHLPAAEIDQSVIQAKVDVEGLIEDRPARFAIRGEKVTFPGWLSAFPDMSPKAENEIPIFESGLAEIEDAPVSAAKTKPPARFTEATLLNAMMNASNFLVGADAKVIKEAKGIGTDATRDTIIETIITRGYVERKKSIKPLDKGFDLIEHLSPSMSSIEMSADWESHLDKIAKTTGDAGREMRDRFLEAQYAHIEPVLEALREKMSALPNQGRSGPSEKMLKLARNIQSTLSVAPEGDVENDYSACRAFIDEHIETYKEQAASNTPPTEKMLDYARRLASENGAKLPADVESSFDACKAFINEQRAQSKPTEGMVRFARSLAEEKQIELPANVETSAEACRAFLDKHAGGKNKKPASKRSASKPRRAKRK